MKRVVSAVMLMMPLVLVGAQQSLTGGEKTPPPPAYEIVKVSPFDTKNALSQAPLSSSPSGVFGMLSVAVNYFAPTTLVQEPEDERMARDIRLAVIGRKPEVLKSLLKGRSGVRCAQIVGGDKLSALHLAAYNGYIDGIVLLYERKVNMNAMNGNGQTALQVALSEGHVDVAKKLVELGVPVEHDEISIVRNLRKQRGGDDEAVKELADLLAEAKKKTILDDIFNTDSDAETDLVDGDAE